ncbi:GTP-binding protein YPT1 [Tritrichomonas foetus]|uniref:GTP-binding protein YPT1 n=1 Tax=Tritrichomonas foetus TaxID=1144522 RepID=A0A1J4L5G5_9EUKA|nr:GTP-binding protein YPT1 [Tritrichomonas foetus]|eukprot:OHT17228.1 GTP-binding protein YPT1 [Tritrichomonas foetus]
MNDNFAAAYSVAIVGNSGVGKTSILQRLYKQTFSNNNLPTIGIEYKAHLVPIEGETVKFVIWDTSGQDRFRNIVINYFKIVHGVIIVFDLTDRKSFIDINRWLEYIRLLNSSDPVIFLVGNKSDEESHFVEYEINEFAQNHNFRYFELSAKDNINIEEAFSLFFQEIHRLNKNDSESNSLGNNAQNTTQGNS